MVKYKVMAYRNMLKCINKSQKRNLDRYLDKV